MSGLQVLAISGLQASAHFGSEARACSKAKSPVAHTLSQSKAQPRLRSQSLSSIFSLGIDGYFLHQFRLIALIPQHRVGLMDLKKFSCYENDGYNQPCQGQVIVKDPAASIIIRNESSQP